MLTMPSLEPVPPEVPTPPRTLQATWLIARRAAIESLRDRMTFVTNMGFAFVVPLLVVVGLVGPQVAAAHTAGALARLGLQMATYMLVVGLLPSSGSVGIASGVFAGEKEQGNLAPLLASPASNGALFAGKVLGAVLPPLLYAAVAEVSFLTEIALFYGPDTLSHLPGVALGMLALVPAVAVFGAAVASVISSRVRTYNIAQTYAGLALFPVMGVLVGLAFAVQALGPWPLVVLLAVVVGLDVVIIALGAATWRREEVMAQR